MRDRPYTVLSCCMSLDGYIDDASPTRLVLSSQADLDRVDGVRAACDALLVGAETVRRDDPRLVVRDSGRREARVARGVPASPLKVTLTESGGLDPSAAFFTTDDIEKLVYAPTAVVPGLRARLADRATVVDAGPSVDVGWLLADLCARGVGRLLVEGGGSVHRQFLEADLADELQLAVAPLFVGDRRAPRFAGDGGSPWTASHRSRLHDVSRLDDTAVLRYALSARFQAA